MLPVLSLHPRPDQLAAFRVGRLGPDELEEIGYHLADCERCCGSLKALPDDSLVHLLRTAATVRPADVAASPTRGPGGAGGSLTSPTVPGEPTLPPELAEHARYRVLGLIGHGGMGAVYKAEHRLMERLVALKVINRRLTDSPTVVERFRREVKAAARLKHPNIVHAYDAEQAGDVHFLVMECVEGTTLARLVQERGPLPVGMACNFARQAALGLQHAFEHSMVHRDIKPHNLIVTSEGEVKILDFGLARFASEVSPDGSLGVPATAAADTDSGGVTEAGTFLGTAEYIAPEQANDPRAADIRSDLYSLGCTLYFLLTGQPPFPEGTLMDKLNAHRGRPPRAVITFRGDVPAAVEDVLQRLLAKDPAQRYQTPAEVVEALAPLISRVTMDFGTREPAAPPPKPPRPSSRAPVEWIAAVLLVALGLCAYLYGGAFYRLATNQGQLVLDTNAADAEILLRQDGEDVRVVGARTGREVNLSAGRYEVIVSRGRVGLQPVPSHFILGRGGRIVVRLREEPANGAPQSDPGSLTRFRGSEGRSFLFEVTGSRGGPVWGTDVYTDDSSLASAAVHAGALREGEKGVVLVTIVRGQDSYCGSGRNGVNSLSYGRWHGSFLIETLGSDLDAQAARRVARADPGSLGAYRGRAPGTFYFLLTGDTAGTVWGTDVYTDDSPLAAAAVHAGVLRTGERGIVKVMFLPGQAEYKGSTRNGVTSHPWGSFDGSFRVEAVAGTRQAPPEPGAEADEHKQ